MPTILIVDDEPAIREMIRFALAPRGLNFTEAGDSEQALEAIRRQRPDLILLDWMLPGRSGLEFAQFLKKDESTRQIPIIMLTARSEEANKVWGLEAGADDYVTKPFSPRELMARIQAVLRRVPRREPPKLMEIDGLRLDPEAHRVSVGERNLVMGPTEYKLLHFFMTHVERVFSRAQLIDLVWGDHVYVEERTVDVHIRRLRKVLETTGHDHLVQTVRGAGYRLSTRKLG